MSLSFLDSINYSIMAVSLIGMPVFLYLMRLLAIKTKLVDVPNARKIHATPVPLVGGLVLFVVSVVLFFMTKNVSLFACSLIVATGFVVMVGLLDDIYQLSALWRFIIQILASLIVIYFSDVQLDSFGFLLLPNWEMSLGVLAIPVTVFGVVGVINALNMADGIDGLAAMTFVVPVFVLVILSQPSEFSLWLLYLLITVLIFVMFNTSKNLKVFLGDNGSLMLGFILAWLLVYFSQGQAAIIKPVTALYLVGLPVYDTIFVMLRRIVNGMSPFKPDKTHLHHLFLACQMTQSQALVAMISSQIVMIVLGLLFLFYGLADYLQFYVFIVLSGLYYFSLQRLWENKQKKEDEK